MRRGFENLENTSEESQNFKNPSLILEEHVSRKILAFFEQTLSLLKDDVVCI